MPAVTPENLDALPVLEEHDGRPRPLQSVVTAQQSFEGAGFPVHRPFPQPGAELTATDPFLMMDEMGPVVYGPGEAKGAPDHPHRGFETVTYLLDGAFEHRDSTGGGGLLLPGDTQWMTAGAGLVHSEMPTAEMQRDGGRMHGLQLWVNLPRTDKRTPPKYQDLPGENLTLARNADGKAFVRIVAGEIGGHTGPGTTHTPIVYAHATLQAGARLSLKWPDVFNALAYVLDGRVRVADDAREIGAHQLAVFAREGETVVLEAVEDANVILLGGRPLREPIAWYGPFVMNTKAEILEAIDDFQEGRMGAIAPTR